MLDRFDRGLRLRANRVGAGTRKTCTAVARPCRKVELLWLDLVVRSERGEAPARAAAKRVQVLLIGKVWDHRIWDLLCFYLPRSLGR